MRTGAVRHPVMPGEVCHAAPHGLLPLSGGVGRLLLAWPSAMNGLQAKAGKPARIRRIVALPRFELGLCGT